MTAVAEPDSRDSGGRAKAAAERVLLVEPVAAAGDEGDPGPPLWAGGAPGSMPGERSALQSERLGRARQRRYGRLDGRPRFSQVRNFHYFFGYIGFESISSDLI